MFDLKVLPDTLKYAYLDEKKIYPVIVNANHSEHEEERLLETLRKHRKAIGYTLDDLKGISHVLCQHAINLEPDAKPVVDHQRRLNPRMKEVVGMGSTGPLLCNKLKILLESVRDVRDSLTRSICRLLH